MTAQLDSQITATYTRAKMGDAYLSTYRNLSLSIEAVHMAMMDKYVEGYNGGMYKVLTTSNGGVARVLDSSKRFQVCNPDNYFDAEMSAEGASLAMFIMALNHQTWRHHARGNDNAVELLVAQQDLLKDYLNDTYLSDGDSASILRFLD
jgi:hypothetical protein